MKISKINAVLIWKQLEDVLVPRLGLTVNERVVYSHLLRHSRLEGKPRLRFSIVWLMRGARLSAPPARPCAASLPRALYAWSNAPAPVTWSRSVCLTRFAPPRLLKLPSPACPVNNAAPTSSKWISCK